MTRWNSKEPQMSSLPRHGGRRCGKTEAVLRSSMNELRAGESLLILRANNDYITITHNPNQIEDKTNG